MRTADLIDKSTSATDGIEIDGDYSLEDFDLETPYFQEIGVLLVSSKSVRKNNAAFKESSSVSADKGRKQKKSSSKDSAETLTSIGTQSAKKQHKSRSGPSTPLRNDTSSNSEKYKTKKNDPKNEVAERLSEVSIAFKDKIQITIENKEKKAGQCPRKCYEEPIKCNANKEKKNNKKASCGCHKESVGRRNKGCMFGCLTPQGKILVPKETSTNIKRPKSSEEDNESYSSNKNSRPNSRCADNCIEEEELSEDEEETYGTRKYVLAPNEITGCRIVETKTVRKFIPQCHNTSKKIFLECSSEDMNDVILPLPLGECKRCRPNIKNPESRRRADCKSPQKRKMYYIAEEDEDSECGTEVSVENLMLNPEDIHVMVKNFEGEMFEFDPRYVKDGKFLRLLIHIQPKDLMGHFFSKDKEDSFHKKGGANQRKDKCEGVSVIFNDQKKETLYKDNFSQTPFLKPPFRNKKDSKICSNGECGKSSCKTSWNMTSKRSSTGKCREMLKVLPLKNLSKVYVKLETGCSKEEDNTDCKTSESPNEVSVPLASLVKIIMEAENSPKKCTCKDPERETQTDDGLRRPMKRDNLTTMQRKYQKRKSFSSNEFTDGGTFERGSQTAKINKTSH